MIISPKEQFLLAHKSEAEQLALQANQPALTIGITYALAEMACHGASQEQLAGARFGFETLLNLPVPNATIKPLPAKQLSETPPSLTPSKPKQS